MTFEPRACAALMAVLSACAPVGPPIVPTTSVPIAASTRESLPVASRTSDGWRVGDPVEVEWKGSWWPAVVVDRRDRGWLVHYDGYGDEWDEVVVEARIRASGAGDSEPEEAGEP